jgi:immune inhibitor A
VLAEFGDSIDPVIGGSPGPRRNQIPQPDRQVDNNTPWAPDFSKAYYEQLLFADAPGAISMRTYYREQSSNRYTVNGEVADWVRLSFNEAYYGTKQCGSTCFERPWMFVRDSINAWYAAQIAAGSTPEQIDTYLSRFDRWDRYDHDGDGNFSEPDGYIDHFQTIHAGEAYEQGGGAQGKDAIWSHKGYAYATGIGVIGPPLNPLGGSRIGGSRYWVADYIVVGENSPVGVIVHEFGHDLGLPDLYDRAGNFGGTNNSTGAWTLMSGGEWTSSGLADDGIGSMPVHMGAWEKITLGWSNFEVVTAGQYRALKLGPAETSTRQRQQLVVLLPDKVLTSDTGPPYAGSFFYFSGIGDLIDSSMTRSLTIPAGAVMLHAKVRYDIELDWDYAYLTVNGVPIATNLSTGVNPNGQNFGHGITGSSGGKWIDLTADFSAFAGQSVTIGFRYWTDQWVRRRRHRDHRAVDRRRGSGRGLDVQRLLAIHRRRAPSLFQCLPGGVPSVSRLRRGAAQRCVRLSARSSFVGPPLSVRGWPAGLVLRHVIQGQRRDCALPVGPMRRPCPARRRASRAARSPRRPHLGSDRPVPRFDIWIEAHG